MKIMWLSPMLQESLQWRLLKQGKLMKLYKNTFDVEAMRRSMCVCVCVWFVQPEGEPPLVAR